MEIVKIEQNIDTDLDNFDWLKVLREESTNIKAKSIQKMEGHHTVKEALDFAKNLNIKRLILTQVGHTYPDYDTAVKEIQKYWEEEGNSDIEVILAYDGLKIGVPIDFKIEKAIKPGSHFTPPKPRMKFYTEIWSGEELYDVWGKKRLDKGIKLYVEQKWNGFRTLINKNGDNITIRFEDAQIDRSDTMPEIVEIIKKIPNDIIIDSECMIYKNNKPIPRIHMMKLLGKDVKLDLNERICFGIFDMPFWKNDLTDRPLRDRKKLLKNVYNKYLKGDHFIFTEATEVGDKDELLKAIEEKSKEPESEGAVIKECDSPYKEGGVDYLSKVKTVMEIKVIVLDKEETETKGIYTYTCGISV